MPYVNIKITNENVTPEKKEALIQGVTDLLKNVLGKNPKTTVVVIDEVETDNWGIDGQSVTQRRKRGEPDGSEPNKFAPLCGLSAGHYALQHAKIL